MLNCPSQKFSITTRGVGLSVCDLCFIAGAGADITLPIYAMYRVYLGLLEGKIAQINCYSYEPVNVYKSPIKVYEFKKLEDIAFVPAPIKRIIDAVDLIYDNGTEYIPFVAAQLRDEEGRLIPQPESVLLSSLRAVVEALSTAETPLEYRAAFKQNCPIPGAVWDNDLLLNADEIIPEGYNLDLQHNLFNDMFPVHIYLRKMQKEFPNLTIGPLSKLELRPNPTKVVSKAVFVSNNMENLRALPRERLEHNSEPESLREYSLKCFPQGNSDSFGELQKLSEAERHDGTLALLGEFPNVAVLGERAAPLLDLYSLRRVDDATGCHSLDNSFLAALIKANNNLLFPMTSERPIQGDGNARRTRNARRGNRH